MENITTIYKDLIVVLSWSKLDEVSYGELKRHLFLIRKIMIKNNFGYTEHLDTWT